MNTNQLKQIQTETDQHSLVITMSMMLVHSAILLLAFYLGYYTRFGTLYLVESYAFAFLSTAPIFLLTGLFFRCYSGFRGKGYVPIAAGVCKSVALAGAVLAMIFYLTQQGQISRLFFAYYLGYISVALLILNLGFKYLHSRMLAAGFRNKNIALVGSGLLFEELRAALTESNKAGLFLQCSLSFPEASPVSIIKKIWGGSVDEVYISICRSINEGDDLTKLLELLEERGLPVTIIHTLPNLKEYYAQHPALIFGKPATVIRPHNLDYDQLLIKRAMDVLGALIGLLILAFLFPVTALAIKLDSQGPIFFRQQRVGKHGQEFSIVKFRTMREGAEYSLDELLEENSHKGPLFKMENDPRITKTGIVLRKYSLDELPQFWNVLKGEMSLVGTRPPTLREVSDYLPHHFRRISMRPGLSGAWQVSGRNEVEDFEDVVKLDVNYIKTWTPWRDLVIIAKTIAVVLRPNTTAGS